MFLIGSALIVLLMFPLKEFVVKVKEKRFVKKLQNAYLIALLLKYVLTF
jgi:hypothetical protein